MLIVSFHIDIKHIESDIISMARLQAEKSRCRTTLEAWLPKFESVAINADPADRLLILNLRLWYATNQIMMQGEMYGPEKRFDQFTDLFNDMMRYGEQLAVETALANQPRSFSYDFGYVIPLYFVGTRCRDPVLRRRAVKILHRYPRQEGVWESTAAAAVCAKWIMVEEQGLTVNRAEDIPEHKRVHHVDTQVDVSTKSAKLTLAPRPPEPVHHVIARWDSENSDAALLLSQSVQTPPDLRQTAVGRETPDFDVLSTSESDSQLATGEASSAEEDSTRLAIR
jgi:hypothetical protein